MNIAVTGGTGFIGKHLITHLLEQGDEVLIISRSSQPQYSFGTSKKVRTTTWLQLKEQPDVLEGVQAIINLAGASINQRWTSKAKQEIIESRKQAAENLADAVSKLKRKPQVLINASGMSIYGTSETEIFDETSPPRIQDFLSSVVDMWEKAADQIDIPRTVKLRVGLVIGRDGGAYPKMKFPYRIGVGGRVGSGRQWVSWIHIEDIVRLIDFCLRNETISGPVNATAPHPVTMDDFGRAVASITNRPHWFPVPAWIMKMVFGELSILLLQGQQVLPQKALDHGFTFLYPDIRIAVEQLEA